MPDFVILGNTPWVRPTKGGNSSRQYARAALRRGWRVSYIQKDRTTALTQLEELDLGPGTVAMCDMPWVDFYYDLFHALKERGCRTVYRCVDNWYLTPLATTYDEEREQAFIRSADAVFVSNPLTIERFQHIRSDIALLRNGADLGLFWRRGTEQPEDLRRGEPTVVFVASFWDPEWLDWDVLVYAAEAAPALAINVLGDAEKLGDRPAPPNIHLLGTKKWLELPSYLNHSDVGAVAYDRERTRYNNPIKVLEYLASGLAVVSPPNVSVADYPYVYFYVSPEDFLTQVRVAAAAPIDRDYLWRTLSEHTWDRRLDDLMARLDSVAPLGSREAQPRPRESLEEVLTGR